MQSSAICIESWPALYFLGPFESGNTDEIKTGLSIGMTSPANRRGAAPELRTIKKETRETSIDKSSGEKA